MSEIGGTSALTYRQERAVVALLSSRSIAEAAEKAEVSERSIERWLADSPDFVSAFRAARTQIVENAIARLQEATSEAVECLVRNMREAQPPTQVRAAQLVLDGSLRAVELFDLADKLEAFERYMDG